jgi:hypothetical protein
MLICSKSGRVNGYLDKKNNTLKFRAEVASVDLIGIATVDFSKRIITNLYDEMHVYSKRFANLHN